MRLGKNPTRPKTRIDNTGTDACHLLDRLSRHHPGLLAGPQVQAAVVIATSATMDTANVRAPLLSLAQLAFQDGDLVPQHEDLHILVSVVHGQQAQ